MLPRKFALLLASTLTSAFAPAAVVSAQTAPPARVAHAAETCSAERGQQLIDAGRYQQAVREFGCLIEADPTDVEGYRGRIEAQLLLGRFADALADYGRVTAFVEPVQPDAASLVLAHYDERLTLAPGDVRALTGASFARWWLFQYAQAVQLLHDLLHVSPDDVYGNLFRGSSRLLRGATREDGQADLERAIQLAPQSPDVRFVVADAYTYGPGADPQRAFEEAMRAYSWGLRTPRVHAILASSYLAFGDELAAAIHIGAHVELVTTELQAALPLERRTTLALDLVPGRSWEIPIDAGAGETISITTASGDFWDTILVLLGPDGSPVAGSDDFKGYYAGLDWVAPAAGTYRMRVTSFEAIGTGELAVKRY